MDNVFTKEAMEQAIDKLLEKHDSCGVDGIMISQYRDYYDLNGENIREKILKGTYKPNAVQLVEILMKTGKKRPISIYTCTDRVIQEVLKNYLTPLWKNEFSKYSYAYQENKGIQEAVKQCAEYIEAGHQWVVEIDVKEFFEHINLERLTSILEKRILDKRLLKLIHSYLYIMVQEDGNKYRKTIDLMQGSALSPLLSNIYMHKFDIYMEKYHFCRFSDDINIYCDSLERAERCKKDVENFLERELGLECSREKCGIYPAMARHYLGYEFYKRKNDKKIYVRRYKFDSSVYYKNWKSSAIQRIDRNYHLINDGILTRKDFTVLFENEDGKRYLPVETCGAINVYSQVAFNSSFFEYAQKKNLNINIFGKYGTYIGSFYTTTHKEATKVMLKQAAIYNDMKKRTEIACKIELASLHNVRENLRYYYKRKKCEQLKEAIDYITKCMDEMKECGNVDELMLVEARAKQKYLQCFDRMVGNTDFSFEKRTRRPPQNEINALLSFGNVFLYQRISTEIRKTALDIRIGFLHASNSRNETFNLDIAEIFKPIIVDRAIFTLIHNMMLTKSEHFEKHSDGGVWLNKEGKRIYIHELEKKLYQKVKVNGVNRTYDAIIKDEIQKIVHVVKEDVKYKPYKYT